MPLKERCQTCQSNKKNTKTKSVDMYLHVLILHVHWLRRPWFKKSLGLCFSLYVSTKRARSGLAGSWAGSEWGHRGWNWDDQPSQPRRDTDTKLTLYFEVDSNQSLIFSMQCNAIQVFFKSCLSVFFSPGFLSVVVLFLWMQLFWS